MRKANFAFLALTILIALVAVPVYGQSFRVSAKIPFDFVVGKTTMPAGEYTIDTMVGHGIVHLSNPESGKSVVVLYELTPLPKGVETSQSSLTFHRYDKTYFLSTVWDGFKSTECLIPATSKEKALQSNASLHVPDEEPVVLAQR